MVYLDWAASALPDKELAPTAPFANPSSPHRAGIEARAALEDARKRCAAVLHINSETLYFTGSGTEANAIVVHSFLRRKLESGNTGALLFSAAEHPSVRENCLLLARYGLETREIPIEKDGRLSTKGLEKAFSDGKPPAFAAIMAVNNEIGAVNDIKALVFKIRELETLQKSRPCHVHVDCVQALGKLPLDLCGCDVDSASFSAHKIGAPRGIGLLYLKKLLPAPWTGGGQERGLRSGTENTAGALSFAAAIERYAQPEILQKNRLEAEKRMTALSEGLKLLPRCRILPEARDVAVFSPYILSAAFEGIPGEVFVRALDERGIAVSTGAACSASKKERALFSALGIPPKTAFETLRISQGFSTTDADIKALLSAIKDTLLKL